MCFSSLANLKRWPCEIARNHEMPGPASDRCPAAKGAALSVRVFYQSSTSLPAPCRVVSIWYSHKRELPKNASCCCQSKLRTTDSAQEYEPERRIISPKTNRRLSSNVPGDMSSHAKSALSRAYKAECSILNTSCSVSVKVCRGKVAVFQGVEFCLLASLITLISVPYPE